MKPSKTEKIPTLFEDSKLASFQGRLPELGAITVMPDYFVDRFVRFDSFDQLARAIKTKGIESGGGSIRGIEQDEVKGGNAVNLAYALGRLGASVRIMAIANGLAAETLKSTFSDMKGVTLYTIDGKCGYTVALEYEEAGRHVNVMVSDTGDLREFDGSKISQWDAIKNSKIVGVLNWAANRSGNTLCETVFDFAHQNKARTFFDPADITELSHLLAEFKRRVLDRRLVDILSLNENETRVMCKALCNYSLPQDFSEAELVTALKTLCDVSGASVDIHTREQSLSSENGKDYSSVRCHKVEQKIVTGAGDVWDAADLAGYLVGTYSG